MFVAKSWLYLATVFAVLTSAVASPASIPDFFDELFDEFRTEYYSLRHSEFAAFCSAHDLDAADAANRQIFLKVHFFHDLLTTVSASDCARGGFLRIPYFWHWVEPNPRHAIISLPDSVLLSTLSPQAPYDRYATVADIDRVPSLFLGDLVADAPGYSHPKCGSFYSFGWCSEREMAFIAIMNAWGYNGKIWQTGIHTYSVVWCEFKTSGGAVRNFAAQVDNTFDSIDWQPIPESTQLSQWLGAIGAGTQAAWYNTTARSTGQLEALQNIPVNDHARTRLRQLVGNAVAAGG
ncbi:MAG: hypothetical protein JSW50_01095 [Candidatus Latescibacterota bacterium]|nr:MAG: hypothetical protein JSW50_01095 [Candidatus Latescibacterota bacterium]